METETPRHVHERDQAAAALDDVAAVSRRAARHTTYPLWFWLLSGLGIAAIPSSASAGVAAPWVALAAATAIFGSSLAVARGGRVHARCLTLGPGEWWRECAVAVPTVVTTFAAVVVAGASDAWPVSVTAGLVAAAAWVLTGVVTGRIGAGWR